MIKIQTHLWVAGSAWISKIITASIQILSIRFLISYLGMDGYGVFVVLLSLSGWFSLSDFGIGSSIQNFVSEFRAKGKDYRPVLSQAMFLILISFAFFVLFALFISYPLSNVLFIKLTSSISLSSSIVFLSAFIWITTALSSVSYRIFYAEQRGYLSNIFPAVASIITLLLLYVITIFKPSGNIFIWAICAYSLPPCLAALIGYFYIFKKIIPSYFDFDKSLFLKIMNRSWKFWGFAIMSAGVLQIDYFVMSQVLDVREITIYNIISKVFLLIHFIYAAILSALWPSCTEYMDKKDFYSVKKMIKQSLLFGFILIISGTIAFALLSKYIVDIISPEPLTVSVLTILLFGFYYILRVWSDIFSIILLSVSKMKIFWIYVPIQALLSLTFQYFFASYYGINGILLGLCVSFIFTSVWILPVTVYNEIIRRKGNV